MASLVLALAVVSLTPAALNMLPTGWACTGTLRVYAPAHAENRRIVIQQNDGTEQVDVSEADIPSVGFSRELHLTLIEGEQRTVTAWVLGPMNRIRGTAVARVRCLGEL